MGLEFSGVDLPSDRDRLVGFLCSERWPFHGRPRLNPADVDEMEFEPPDVESYWVVDGSQTIGLARVLDLDDIGDGAVQFDLRIAARYRGVGHGGEVTRWLVRQCFERHRDLHRIEAHTRDDNVAMQRALAGAGFVHEGTLRESWAGDDGRRFDTFVYGLLRRDWLSATS